MCAQGDLKHFEMSSEMHTKDNVYVQRELLTNI